MGQPDLDYTAPEVQNHSKCSPLSDMFSLGLVICAVFNGGHSLIEANLSCATYQKQLEMELNLWGSTMYYSKAYIYPEQSDQNSFWMASNFSVDNHLGLLATRGPLSECTMRYDRASRHTSSVWCLETFRSIFAVTLLLVHSNLWDAQFAIPNDPRYARLETNLGIEQAKEG
ncbi:SCY1-like protein 2 [Trichonephila clavipes]|uniref:SCY1-like protein 2 n=1 Tax=Trichonephila clavipes TaxID=2585209 RepID=A0A8X6S3M9_TRICX|nr:SCY1-like protein 2 [Trichonephila clavipes]